MPLHGAHTRAQAENPFCPRPPLHFGTRQHPERWKVTVGNDGDPNLPSTSTKTNNASTSTHRTSPQALAAR